MIVKVKVMLLLTAPLVPVTVTVEMARAEVQAVIPANIASAAKAIRTNLRFLNKRHSMVRRATAKRQGKVRKLPIGARVCRMVGTETSTG
jgi:hypothetical protein